jgi:transposase-like protein
MPRIGYRQTQEHRDRLSASHMGKRHSEATRAAIGRALALEWSEKAVETVKRMAAEGASVGQIAQKIGVDPHTFVRARKEGLFV